MTSTPSTKEKCSSSPSSPTDAQSAVLLATPRLLCVLVDEHAALTAAELRHSSLKPGLPSASAMLAALTKLPPSPRMQQELEAINSSLAPHVGCAPLSLGSSLAPGDGHLLTRDVEGGGIHSESGVEASPDRVRDEARSAREAPVG